MCLGKKFVLAQVKTALLVMIRNFEFEFEHGAKIEIETVQGLLPRPRITNKNGLGVPLRVRRVA